MALIAFSRPLACGLLSFAALANCGHVSQGTVPPVVLIPDKGNAVAVWSEIGAATVNTTVATSATEAEKYVAFPADMATMHLAMYDALVAIDRRYRPVHFAPAQPATGASVDAATAAAAYGVLRALFPSRAAHYQQAYDDYIAAIPESAGKASGISLGAAAAAAHLQRRASDGRSTELRPYAANPDAGRFRGVNPINRNWPSIRPFILSSISQFRPARPPALSSAEYAADFIEVKELGGKASARRTAEQLETARFHSEPPVAHLTRNYARFARTTNDTVAAARLMAAMYANYADAISACLDAKYHYDTWRPQSAIPLADTDNNPATIADAAWTPVIPTPNHPEYPAAHSCASASLGELLRQYYGTDRVTFSWDSKVTGTTRSYTNTDGLTRDSQMARIYGGMHFRYSTTAGEVLGKQVAQWTMRNAFAAEPK
ncbi:MAG: vanadium-dependent haloperoxidase [Pseudomonadota bacterium]